MRRILVITLMSALVAAGAGLALEPAPLLGQLAGSGAALDGAEVPSGTSLMDGATVTTGSEPVSVHFLGGTMVRMAGASSGRFERLSPNVVRVSMLSGALAFQDQGGEVRTAGEGSTVELEVERPGDEPEREEVDVCHLVDPEPEELPICVEDPREDECEWERIEVQLDLLGDHMTAHPADIPIDEELRELHRGPDVPLPRGCRRAIIPILPVWLLGGGGTFATGVVLDELINNDPQVDEDVFSPVQN